MQCKEHEIFLGLKRISKVASGLNLHFTAKIILIAGTNGKGTTVAALDAIYRTAGLRVGTFTSPHLLDFNERIQVNGQKITNDEFAQAVSRVKITGDAIQLTYFELVTLAAMVHFNRHSLDILIFEVGLGGRLDATNILSPDIAIITGIDYDHQQLLGNTLEQIGFEKAGILRYGKPLIYADLKPPNSILATAYALACPLYINGQHYHIIDNHNELIFSYSNTVMQLSHVPWHKNAIAAACMVTQYWQQLFPISMVTIINGINAIALSGRQQFITQNQIITCLDVAHNSQSVKYLATTIKNQLFKKQYKKIYAVFAALNDKDIPSLIYPMQDLVTFWYPALLDSPRAANRIQLMQAFIKNGIIVNQFYESPVKAYKKACHSAGSGDLIIVYGSFLTVNSVWTMFARSA